MEPVGSNSAPEVGSYVALPEVHLDLSPPKAGVLWSRWRAAALALPCALPARSVAAAWAVCSVQWLALDAVELLGCGQGRPGVAGAR